MKWFGNEAYFQWSGGFQGMYLWIMKYLYLYMESMECKAYMCIFCICIIDSHLCVCVCVCVCCCPGDFEEVEEPTKDSQGQPKTKVI